jgi:hypothetical protein
MAKQNRNKDRNRRANIDIHNHIKERQNMKILIKERQNRKKDRNRRANINIHNNIKESQNRKKNRNRRVNIDNQYHMWLSVLLKKKYKCYFSRF